MINTEDDSLLYRSGQSRGRLLWFIGIGLFIAWNLLLFILAVVAIAKVNNMNTSSGSSYTYAPISRNFAVGNNQQLSGYDVVSLQNDGKVRIGGGTTVFPSRGQLPVVPAKAQNLVGITFNPPLGAELTPLTKSELAFLAYTLDNKVYGALGILTVSGTSLQTWADATEIPGLTISEDMIALNIQSGTMKSFVIAGGGKLVVGSITNESPAGLAFKTSPAQAYNGTDSTVLARLSFAEFAIAYRTIIGLQPNPVHKMEASVGTVTYTSTGEFETFSVSPGVSYVANRPYHTIFPFVDPSKPTNEFVVAYPALPALIINSTETAEDSLIVQKATWNAVGQNITFGPRSSLQGVVPNFLMTSVAMPTTPENDQPKGVIIFIDEAEDNSLSAITVYRDPGNPAQIDGLAFGEIEVISRYAADSTFQVRNGSTVVPYISASAFDDVHIGLAYSDFADYGKITTTILSVNPHRLSIGSASADFVISGPNPNLGGAYWWVQTAPLHFGAQMGYAVWAYLETGSSRSDVVIQSVVEMAPPPIGIIPGSFTNIVSDGNVPIVVSGVYQYFTFHYQVGRLYYTDTLGNLHVRNGTQTSVDYVVGENGVLLSLNSRIGVAISPTELLLLNELS